MTTITNVTGTGFPAAWQAALERHGFGESGDAFTRDGMEFRCDGRWITLETPGPILSDEPPSAERGQRGLWKERLGSGGYARRVFEVPATVVSADEPDELGDEGASLDAILEWALAAARNELPDNWEPPDRATVESWMPQGALDWQSGPFVRKGELIVAPGRWAIRLPVVPTVPSVLPPAREVLLRELIGDANAQWKMVRQGTTHTKDGRALMAVVDLSGAPHSQPLFLAGLDGLRHVVGWLVEAADLLADVKVTLATLEVISN